MVKCPRTSFKPCTNMFLYCLSTHPFFHLSIHSSIILILMHSMKHELVSFYCPALRKRRNKWKKVKEDKECLTSVDFLLWYDTGMHCMIGAQIVCCKDSGVCMFIVHWVFSSTSSLWFSLLDSPDKHLRPRTLLQSFPLISLSETEANRPLKWICLARDVD